ncbi:UNVERIFIED_CONTAM: hypothetical protein K2H54_010081 [Gekko kuhli]
MEKLEIGVVEEEDGIAKENTLESVLKRRTNTGSERREIPVTAVGLGYHQVCGISRTEGQRHVDGQEEKVLWGFGVNMTYPTSSLLPFRL